jgi:hypothetical protein
VLRVDAARIMALTSKHAAPLFDAQVAVVEDCAQWRVPDAVLAFSLEELSTVLFRVSCPASEDACQLFPDRVVRPQELGGGALHFW